MIYRAIRIGLVSSALLLVGLGTVGCFAIGGSPKTYVDKPTMGQELADLKKAHDCGAISGAEYDRLKCEILSRPAHGGN
jgi:hypothetical protein